MQQSLRCLTAAVAAIGAVGAVGAAQAAEMATVVSSTPVIVSVAAPRQVCSDSRQIVQQRPSGAGALLGAIAGGVIGHNVGNGVGRAAATGIGAVTGAVIGDQVEAANSPVSEVPVRRCQLVSGHEQRVVGYDVMYDYAGQRYSTRMTRDPGQQFAVSVQPADSGALPEPASPSREGTPVPSTSAPQPIYYEPARQPLYYEPAPQPVYYVDYGPSPIYVAPMIGFGIGYYGGYYGGYRGHHRWR